MKIEKREVRKEEKREEREREGGSDWRSEQEELRRLSGRVTDLRGCLDTAEETRKRR